MEGASPIDYEGCSRRSGVQFGPVEQVKPRARCALITEKSDRRANRLFIDVAEVKAQVLRCGLGHRAQEGLGHGPAGAHDKHTSTIGCLVFGGFYH